MFLWKFSHDLGLFPYPKLSYFNVIRILVPIFLTVVWVKYYLFSIPDNFDKIQGLLYAIRGTFEMLIVLVHNWRLSSRKEDVRKVMEVEGVSEIGVGLPILLAIITNFPELIFIVFIVIDSRFGQPTNGGNGALMILDTIITFIALQFSFILQHMSGLIRKETNSKGDLLIRANKVYDMVLVARSVEIIFNIQNFMIVFRVIYTSLYAMYMFIRFPFETKINLTYRVLNVMTHFSNLFIIVNGSDKFRAEKKLTLYALGKQNAVFTGSRCFKLNYSLMKTVLAVAVSYFVVMEQYKVVGKEGMDSDEEDDEE